MISSFCKQIAVLVLLSILTAEAQVTCNETYVLIFESNNRISCAYDSLFISVRWYTVDSPLPIAVLERGRTKTSDGFDIAENGDLVIHRVTLQHEGSYRISVTERNGNSETEEVTAFVIVPLDAPPNILSCQTSDDNLCQNINHEERQNVLICQTTNTRPGVNFRWLKLSSQGNVVIDPKHFMNNVTVNNKTKLFSSTSLMRYDHHSFRLQYFTCEATGVAVRDDWKQLIFVEGDGDTETSTSNVKIVDKGSAVSLKCFDGVCLLRRWRVTYLNGTAKILETFPDGKNDVCFSEKQCRVDTQGALTIRDVSHLNEGHYECICGNGNATMRSTTEVIARIAPTSEEIFIQGCKNNSRCDKVVSLTGRIEASVYGARPPIEIKCKVADGSKTFIFNDKSETVSHVEKGTFDTIYSVEYDIQECSAPVHVVCMVSEDSVHEDLLASNVYLITDTSSCSNEKRPWVAIIVVIVFLTLIVAAVIALYFKRERVRGFQNLCFSHQMEEGVHYTPVQQSESDPFSANTMVTSPARDKEEEAEKREYKYGEKHLEEFEDLYSKIQNNEIQNESFRQKMEIYSEIKEGNLPQSFLSFMTEKDLYENKPWEVVKFVGGCVPCSQLAVVKFLNVCEEFCYTEKISKTNYMEITGPLVKCDAVSTKIIEKELANIEKVKANKTEWSDWLLEYAIDNYRKDASAMQTIIRESKLLPYPYFLQSTYKHIKKIDPGDKCFNWFKDIITSHLALSLVFVEALCLSVSSLSIQSCTCVDLLLTLRKPFVSMEKENEELVTEERTIEDKEINEIFTKICKNSTVPGKACTEILYCSLEKNLIEFHDYINELQRCLRKQMITQQSFEEHVTKLVETKTWRKEQWVKLFVDITKQHLIADGGKVKLFRSATKTYEITESQLKTMVKEYGIAEEKVNIFLSGIKVYGKFGDHILKSKEEKEEESNEEAEEKEKEDQEEERKGKEKGKEKKKEKKKKEDKEKKREKGKKTEEK